MTTPDKPSLGRGDVTVVIDGVEYILKPTLAATQALSRKYGGLHLLVDRIAKLDFEAIVDTVLAGLNRNANPKQRQELAEAIFRTGLTDDTGQVSLLCARYVIILMRGGRPLSQEEESGLFQLANEEGGEDPLNTNAG